MPERQEERQMTVFDQRGIGKLRVLVGLLVLAALVAGYFWAAMKWSYASGERAGWVQQINKLMGRRVNLHYEQKVGLPTSCFGETRYYVTQVTLVEEIQLAPGVVVPTVPAPGTPAAPGAPTPPAAPAAPAGPAATPK
jgi:hypothetical protein